MSIIKRLIALVMALALMIPVVAISEETYAVNISADKTAYSTGDKMVITWEVDPDRADLSKEIAIHMRVVDAVYGNGGVAAEMFMDYDITIVDIPAGVTSGTRTIVIPEGMNGIGNVWVRYTDKTEGNKYIRQIKNIEFTNTAAPQNYLSINYSKPLSELEVNDNLEFSLTYADAFRDMMAWEYMVNVSNWDEEGNMIDLLFERKNVYEGNPSFNFTFEEERRYAVAGYIYFRPTEEYGDEFMVCVSDMFYVGDEPAPSEAPTDKPTVKPTAKPTAAPTTAAPTSGAPTSAPTSAPAEPVELNLDAITIGMKQTVDTVKVVTGKNITWTSSDEKIARVDADGNITGVKKGKATITATSAEGESDSVEVTVVAKNKGVKKIKLNKKKASIDQGEKLALKATLTPADAKNKKIIWTSSNEKVATVNAKGKVKAVGVGEATITAVSSSGKIATCKITVTGAKVKKIAIEGNKKMKVGETQTLVANILPEFAANKDVTWKTSAKKIATVDENGVVTARKKGTVTISAVANDGSKVKASIIIKIKK